MSAKEQPFNIETWKSNAWERHVRLSKRVGSTKLTYANVINEHMVITQISLVIDWCLRNDVTVVFTNTSDSYYDSSLKKIVIRRNLSVQKQLHLLLHECGHYLLYEKICPGKFQRKKQTFIDRCNILHEELEAWSQGKSIADDVGIDLDTKSYDKTRSESLRDYVKWSLRPGDYSV